MATYKVVINCCSGGFDLSIAAINRLIDLGYTGRICDISRHDPRLVQVVEELGEYSWGTCANLNIVEITCPKYIIINHSGNEIILDRNTDEWIDARVIKCPAHVE